MIYSFDPFRLDTQRCTLSRDGENIPLRPKVFDLLRFFAERPGQLASKDEIFARLWPDVVVEETSLAQCVSHLRRSLGPHGGELIKTVPRRGYVFEADVSSAHPERGAASNVRTAILAATVFAAGIGAGFFGSTASDRGDAYPEFMLDATTTVLGQELVYPGTAARLVASIKILPPGVSSPPHDHDSPLFAYILEGEVEIDYGSEGTRRFSAGEALVEAVDVLHVARGVSSETARILVVEMLEQ